MVVSTHLYSLTVSMGQEPCHGLKGSSAAGSFTSQNSRYQAGLRLHLKVPLQKEMLPSPHGCWHNSVPHRFLDCGALVPCWPEAVLSFLLVSLSNMMKLSSSNPVSEGVCNDVSHSFIQSNHGSDIPLPLLHFFVQKSLAQLTQERD